MKSKKSPTARTLEALRKLSMEAQVVEKWLPGRRAKAGGAPGETESTPYGVRKDLFGCIDIVALDGLPGCLGVQACAGASASDRMNKAGAEPKLMTWLLARNRYQVWAWREVWVDTSSRTKRKQWEPRVMQAEIDGDRIVFVPYTLTSARGTASTQLPETARLRDQDPNPALRPQERPADIIQGGASGGGEAALSTILPSTPGLVPREAGPGLFDDLPET